MANQRTTRSTQKNKYEVVFWLEDINEDKLFQHQTVYKEYVKLIKNAQVLLINKGEREKAMGVKELLERLVSDGEVYLAENTDAT